MHFKNRAALVTGASRGLGRGLADELGRQGARVVLVARPSAALEETVAKLRRAGAEAYALPADLADKSAIHALCGAAAALVGPIDLLIHNASVLGPTPLGLLLDTECEEFAAVWEVNLLAPFRLTRAIAGSMALRGTGTIVHISSDAAVNAYPRWGAYGVSKAALDQLSRSWASELAELGVRVLAVDPGEMDTAMHAAALPDADRSTLAQPDEVARRIVAHIADSSWPTGERWIVRS